MICFIELYFEGGVGNVIANHSEIENFFFSFVVIGLRVYHGVYIMLYVMPKLNLNFKLAFRCC